MKTQPAFALNRIMQPDLPLPDFIKLASECSAFGVEIRNDLQDPSLLGGETPEDVRTLCNEFGIEILTVNALQRFNDPDLFVDKTRELTEIMESSNAVGCRRIVLCPVNDPADKRSPKEQHVDLVSALNHYAPLFDKYGMTGLVEPLGFEICSVRYKKQAVEAIAETGLSRHYQIVHDTFHHYLSGEDEFFPKETGLIHASGIYEGKNLNEVDDDDRLLVDEKDIMDNKGQISKLYAGGFQGIMSFEPFSPEIQKLSAADIRTDLHASMDYLFS